METVFRLKATELTSGFIETIRTFIKNKNSVITVKIETPQDETEYLLSSPNNRKALEESLKSKEGYIFTWDEFKQLNKDLLSGKKIELSKIKRTKLS